jgi:hypothetical protein
MTVMLVERAEEGSRRALRLLANIADQGAVAELRTVAVHDDPKIRSAAVNSLGWSGVAGGTAAVVAALGDSEPSVRKSARAALAELGGRDAADALAQNMADVADEEHLEAVQSLAWLRDPQALEPALLLARAGLREPPYTGRRGWRNSVWAAVRLGDSAYRQTLVAKLIDLATQVEDLDVRSPSPQLTEARNAYANVSLALRLEHPEEVPRALEALWQGAPAQAAVVTGRQRLAAPSAIVSLEPVGRRSVPRLALAEHGEQAAQDDVFARAKLGGQPDWVGAPTWPLGADGRPLVFYAQLPLIDEPRRVAYVFVSADERADTFKPLADGNAVVIQPGGPSHLPTAPMPVGPALFETTDHTGRLHRLMQARPYERYVRLEQGADPPTWEWPDPPEGSTGKDQHGDWNKIGGTPLWLQAEEPPPGEGWRFAFQFSADWAGRELGDGAECYGFVRDDGTGAFLWQCH